MDCVMIDRAAYDRIKDQCDSLEHRNIALEQENVTLKNELQLFRKLCTSLEHIKHNLQKTIDTIKVQFNFSHIQFASEKDIIQWIDEYNNIKMMIEEQQLNHHINNQISSLNQYHRNTLREEQQFNNIHVQEEVTSGGIRPSQSQITTPMMKTSKPRRNQKSNEKMNVSTESETKKFNCSWTGCKYATNSSGNFQKHYRIHTGEKPYKCEYEGCTYSCSDPTRIKEHNRIHKTEKEFNCDWPGCELKFTAPSTLKNHIRACHTGDKPHKCDYTGCGKSYLAPHTLRVHKLKHKGLRPFKCDINNCTKTFILNKHLDRHKSEIHFNDKTFKCEYPNCDAAFYRMYSLRYHIKHKHVSPPNKESRIPKRSRGRPKKLKSNNFTENSRNSTEKITDKSSRNFDDERKVVIDLKAVKLSKGIRPKLKK